MVLMKYTRSGSLYIGQCFNTCLLTGVDVIPVNVYVTVSVGPRLLVPEPQSVTWNQNILNKVFNDAMVIKVFLV